MMKIVMLIMSFLPILCGSAINWYMATNPNTVPPFFLIAVIFLLFWCFLSYLFCGKRNSTKEVLLMLNCIAAVDLLLVGIQELILHAYWMNAVGSLTQLYYLPLLNVGFRLTIWSHSVFAAYVVCFLMMVGASLVGCIIRKKKDV